MIVTSMAGTARQYVVGQGTLTGYNGRLHIQVNGQGGNRSYGFASTTREELPVKLAKYLSSLDTEAKSMAATGKGYFVLQMAVREAGVVHVQIGGPAGNRDYGVVFDYESPELAEFVAKQVAAEVAAIEEAKLKLTPADSFRIR